MKKSFEIVYSRVQFNPLTKRLIRLSVLLTFGVVLLIQFLLYIPIPIDLKAFVVLGSGKTFTVLLFVSGIAFVFFMVLVQFGGDKKQSGKIIINRDSLNFDLKKESSTVSLSNIDTIEMSKDRDKGLWVWKFKTSDQTFSIRFKHIIEQYKAKNLLVEYTKEKYHHLIVENDETSQL
ncbi:MAG: hypothetical protein AAF944_07950 [Bacteroidota bacterium]